MNDHKSDYIRNLGETTETVVFSTGKLRLVLSLFLGFQS